jgi:NAD(P)-dependent dehydrogenase (short-subunit alcohol dehydrogenase family)
MDFILPEISFNLKINQSDNVLSGYILTKSFTLKGIDIMQGKIALVTGATSGIGQETAIGLARLGAHVIITGRNRQRGEAAVAEIQEAGGNPKIDLLIADMTSQTSIHQLADQVIANYPRLDVLVNNVGMVVSTRQLTVDGIELNFAVNHLAPFLLTHRLLPLLKHSAPARVINVTGGIPGKVDLENLQAEKSNYVGFMAYSHSKSIMMAASYEFARRLQGTGVTLNVAYPGGVSSTNMGSQPSTLPLWIRPLFSVVRRTLDTTAEKAARSSIYLASSPEVEGVTGQYFNTNSKNVKWNAAAYDDAVRKSIWELSEWLAHLDSQSAAV